jgi:hypothetical protein
MVAKALIGAAMATLLLAAAPESNERAIPGDGLVDATLAGAPGRVRIDPGGTGMPIYTAAYADRARLRGGMIGFGYAIGPEHVEGATAVTSIGFGAEPVKRRVGWTRRPYAAGIDGVVGPGGLPDPVVRFTLRPRTQGERTTILPMVDGGGLMGSRSGLFALIEVGGEPLRIRFDPWHRRSLATAGAGVRIAQARGGRVLGETGSDEIAFGVERPTRTLVLATPLTVGPLTLKRLGVRTSDFGNTAAIRELGDPDEIVVTGKRQRDRSHDRLSIGSDQLDHCSSIVFDKPAKQIALTCAG